MDLIDKISSISIRGRLAFGITCLEKVCFEWNVRNTKTDELISNFWLFMEFLGYDDHDQKVYDLLPDDDRPWVNASQLSYTYLSEEQQRDLTELIDEVLLIGMRNMAGGFSNDVTLIPTLEVVRILEKNNIKLPDLTPFLKSKVTENEGWGYQVGRDYWLSN
ncbi:hypothetical protein [Mechercharimyces sp. CAU 1602]|uniref:hypothetical protein n=1 Tax=Mechercharimyces sp. CAU 1602 TaxID=2973933 RepID=UPI0021624A78|nr:hypothetical protein [Mechercharimyces sp. CAU 1602]MCS1350886.1 hypothetical protein [Mechercharimyces sp. CAU 1602]